jgi:hypothetical protein
LLKKSPCNAVLKGHGFTGATEAIKSWHGFTGCTKTPSDNETRESCIRARLQSGCKWLKKDKGFSPCGTFFAELASEHDFFRNLFGPGYALHLPRVPSSEKVRTMHWTCQAILQVRLPGDFPKPEPRS